MPLSCKNVIPGIITKGNKKTRRMHTRHSWFNATGKEKAGSCAFWFALEKHPKSEALGKYFRFASAESQLLSCCQYPD
jgi:hypothetical protein